MRGRRIDSKVTLRFVVMRLTQRTQDCVSYQVAVREGARDGIKQLRTSEPEENP